MLVVASTTYLKAIAADLKSALDEVVSTENVSIISSGTQKLDELTDHLIPCDARLQAAVNGARRSLNARIANKIIDDSRGVPSLSPLKKRLKKLSKLQPPIIRYDRKAATDTDVLDFISTELKNDASLRHTPLLRRFRDNGFACEQSRFASLYRKATNGEGN